MVTQRFGKVVLFAIAVLVGAAGTMPPGAFGQLGGLFSHDITLHESTTSTGMGGGKETTSTKYFSGNMMRMASAEGQDTIVRYDHGKIITINHKDKTYSEITLQQMQQMLDKVSGDIGKNKEQTEALRQVMGQTLGQVKVTKQGAGEPVAGYATEKYLISMPPIEMELWAAPSLVVPAVYYDAMKVRMPSNPLFDMGKMIDEFKKIKGLTVKQVMNMSVMNMKSQTTTVVTSVDKGPIPAATFAIPNGYKLVPPKF